MKKSLFVLLCATLLATGCAKQAVQDDLAANEVAAVVEPAPAVEVPVAEPVEEAVVATPKAVEPVAMKIFFDFDSTLLTPDSLEALKGNAAWLQAQPEVRVLIEGHTDERGSSSYNLALGEKRAQAARDYLLTLGIAAERIAIISFGKEKAVQGADSEAVWAQDRRAEFVKTN